MGKSRNSTVNWSTWRMPRTTARTEALQSRRPFCGSLCARELVSDLVALQPKQVDSRPTSERLGWVRVGVIGSPVVAPRNTACTCPRRRWGGRVPNHDFVSAAARRLRARSPLNWESAARNPPGSGTSFPLPKLGEPVLDQQHRGLGGRGPSFRLMDGLRDEESLSAH